MQGLKDNADEAINGRCLCVSWASWNTKIWISVLMDLIMVDHEISTMKGHVPTNYISHFREELKEGSIYTFELFTVADMRKKYRTRDHLCNIGYQKYIVTMHSDIGEAHTDVFLSTRRQAQQSTTRRGST